MNFLQKSIIRFSFCAVSFVALLLTMLCTTLTFARGEPVLVFAAASLKESLEETGKAFTAESHDPIIYPFAVTALSKNPEAEKFLRYLNSPSAKAIFEKAGFIPLTE